MGDGEVTAVELDRDSGRNARPLPTEPLSLMERAVDALMIVLMIAILLGLALALIVGSITIFRFMFG